MAFNKKKPLDEQNIPFSKPGRMDYPFQVDFSNATRGTPEYNIHEFGCCFMCHLTMVQIMHNRPFRKNEVLHIYDTAVDHNWLGDNCWVKDAISIIGYAEKLITGDKPKYKYLNVMCKGITAPERTFGLEYASQARMPSAENIYFWVVDFDTKSGPTHGGHHFELFSGTGNLLYDPNKTQLKCGYVDVAKINYWRVVPF